MRTEPEASNEDIYYDLFNHSPDMYVSVDASTGFIVQCNQTLLDRLQRSRESVVGTEIFSLYHPDCHDEVKRKFQDFLETGEIRSAELTLADSHGNGIPVVLNVSSVRDNTGKIIASRSVWQDVTKLHQTRQELQQLNRELESRVAARTAQIERRNADLEELARILSHDLRSPLRGLRLMVSWLREDCMHILPESSKKMMAQLDQRIGRMDQLLQGILEYARLGRHQPSYKVANIGDDCLRIKESLERPESFKIIIEEPMPTLKTDNIALFRVLQNLISNAVKHRATDDGEVRISHRVVDGVDEFSVADNGGGIEPRFHKKIFEMFQTLSPNDGDEASGIGLSIVKRIVEDAGGIIRVESNGLGTTFRFTWPASIEANGSGT
ncbi:Phytochrome-like protein cph1 [Rubripirellula tenax]|uniref:histidine kinase n=1 Tax=Rubripirellula tenax TaxID=2528015 RepID=A0A5C6FIP7_9BACT|nr:PAS domain-containing sensor histidine kinase [Rubripirellula tenax]TWU60463.1 Phytochrome-like protein cph1 [Rubripirellula tenax]